MRTVPAAAAATWCTSHRSSHPALERSLVLVGARPEVDLDQVALEDPDAADALARWWGRCQELWRRARVDDVDGFGWMRTRHVVVHAVQSTAKGAKRDLVAHLDALVAHDEISAVVLAATSGEPQAAEVSRLAAPLGGSFVAPGDGTARLVLPLRGSLHWPDELGGPAWIGEVARSVTLELRYASWRDRRVRRVAQVDVAVTSLWADPSVG